MSKDKKEQEKTAAFDDAELKSLESEVLGDIKNDEQTTVIEGQHLQPVDEEMRGLVGGLLGMGFAVLAPNWDVKPDEVEQLTEAYTALLCKYCPDGLGNYGVEISAVMLTFAVVAPRLAIPRNKPTAEAEEDTSTAIKQPDILSDEAI